MGSKIFWMRIQKREPIAREWLTCAIVSYQQTMNHTGKHPHQAENKIRELKRLMRKNSERWTWMTKYFCPYCSSSYQIHTQRADGVMVCGQCGDPLITIPSIKPTQIFALKAAGAFITPLIVMMFVFIENQKTPHQKRILAPSKAIPMVMSRLLS